MDEKEFDSVARFGAGLEDPGLKPIFDMKGFSAGLNSSSPLLKQGAPTSRGLLRVLTRGLESLRKNSENLGSPKGAPQIPPLRYAPVGMTILFGNGRESFQDELSSRRDRRDQSSCRG